MITLPKYRGEVRHNFNLSNLTWFKVGGCAEVLFKPTDIDDLSHFLAHLDQEIPVHIIEAGSNIIVRDSGIDGVVVKLGRGFGDIAPVTPAEAGAQNLYNLDSQTSTKPSAEVGGNDHYLLLKVGAAALNYSLAQYALQSGFQGLEFLVGIPGTIGGGIAMNAGSYGSEFKDILHSITMLDRNGQKHILHTEEMGFGYRHNNLKDWAIFVEATFCVRSGDKEQIKAKMDEISTARQQTQPINQKTGGSTFANPDGYKAWQLVDQVGMRGFTIGGAQFSPLHCNFMVNTGNATATELEELGEMARAKVMEQTGVELKWEIKRIGK